MFLDIACVFIGIDKRIAPYLWDHKLCPRIGLKKLIDRSLIYVDYDNKLRMHDDLRDLGRAIARPANKKLWDCSRLWDKEAMIVLRRKVENENIEALRLDERGSKEFMKQESFKNMPNLKFLHVKDVDFDGDFEGSLAELRWLKWGRCCDSFKATNFHLEKLVILDLSGDFFNGNYISENWRGWSSIKMERLKVLDLSQCSRLKTTPNLSAFKNLEMLILKECVYLEEIDPSIRDVKRLVSLNLSYCRSLKKLPEQLGELENLEELVVNKTPIKGIPSSIGKLRELVELDLSYTRIKELPEFIGQLNKLKILKISYSDIKRLPSSIGKLQSLQELNAYGCFHLEGQILVDKGGLSSLKTLYLKDTNISGLPENLDQLSSLEHLYLYRCYGLQSLPKPPCSLSSLWLTCRSNELPSLSHLKHLQELTLDSCMSLQSIPELPSCIRKLCIWRCPKLDGLKQLDGLEALKSLRELSLSLYSDEEADNLHAIRGLEKLGSLEVVDISKRKHIQELDLSKSEHLKWLNVRNCKSLVEIRCPSKFLNLFDRRGCKSLEKFPDFLPHDGHYFLGKK
ncbi:disease resistance protein RPV1-like [Eucalyptus grandis]|uniref:disease resistance protein RPV1-like n=1 Tax=Eucalyptus grandis TaxID=71139 RepID=UPI00192EF475|nr:disease resistance protein RPV1-like [Eucalyptus grandis]